jgi:ferric-dicitrate binding protein FerR (iron transport regulator)
MDLNNAENIWILMAKKLSGEASAEDLQELEQLLRQDPHINYSKEILQDFWCTQPLYDSQYAENKYRKLVQQIKTMGIDEGKFAQNDHFINVCEEETKEVTVKKSRKRLIAAISLIAAIALAGFFLFYSDKQSSQKDAAEFTAKNEISTKSGSKTSLVLPDGTKVWLNASSELTYGKNYGTKLREVTLSGEAYFDVVKNREKPFVIHTAKMDVKVLGTAFNVKCYPGEKTTETSLVRGSIEVTLKDRLEKIMLKPNEKLVINNQDDSTEKNTTSLVKKVVAAKAEKPIITLTHLTLLPADNTIIETAWVQNRLLFSSETFEEVVLKMERWYNVKIFIVDESLKEERLTGNFEKETIVDALNALKLTTKFNYILKNNTINIYKSEIAKK